MTSEKIKDYCEEALIISKEQGVRDGLTFLIGEKLSLIYYQLKTAYNKFGITHPMLAYSCIDSRNPE